MIPSIAFQRFVVSRLMPTARFSTAMFKSNPATSHRNPRWHLIVFAAIGLSGCENKSATEETVTPFEGTQLTVAVPDGYGFDKRLKATLAEWEARTDAAVQLKTYDVQAGNTEPSDAGASVLIMPFESLPQRWWVEAGSAAVTPISAEHQSADWLDWQDMFKGLRENVCSASGKPSVIALSAPTLVCFYRKDLLERANLAPPRTWTEYDQLVRTLGEWAFGLDAVEPWSKEFRATMFLARAMSYARHPDNYSLFFDITSGDPLINSPGFLRAFDESVATEKWLAQECRSMSPEQAVQKIADGTAALAIGFPDQTRSNAQPTKRDKSSEIGVVRLPGSSTVFNHSTDAWEELPRGRVNYAPLVGFAGFVVVVPGNVEKSQIPAINNLVRTIAIDSVSLPDVATGLVRKSQISRTAVRLTSSASHLNPQEIQSYLNAVTESLNDTRLVAELPVLNRNEFKAAITDALVKAIEGDNLDFAGLLSEVEQKWTKLLESTGREKVLDSYRFSLGIR